MNSIVRNIAIGIILLLSFESNSQTVSIYKIDGLLSRIYNKSDTTYIVNFWATWCKPCVAELPEFEKITMAYANKPVKVILVCMDFKEDLTKKLIPFIAKNNYTSEVILLDEINGNDFINKINESWTGAIPATIITSKNKQKNIFLEKKITFEQLESYLKN